MKKKHSENLQLVFLVEHRASRHFTVNRNEFAFIFWH